jgi:hypothetical protein
MYLVDAEDQRSVIRLIKVKNVQQLRSPMQSIGTSSQSSYINQNSMSLNGERFGQGDKQIKISENNLVATYSGPELPRSAFIFGSCNYSIGIHHIHFRIEKTTDDLFFIGIVTFSQTQPSSVFTQPSTVNGWWPSRYAIENGRTREKSSTTSIMQGDQITMILDCEQRQISFDHHRTKQILKLSIDIQKCSLPWKLVIGLGVPGNSLRILP